MPKFEVEKGDPMWNKEYRTRLGAFALLILWPVLITIVPFVEAASCDDYRRGLKSSFNTGLGALNVFASAAFLPWEPVEEP